MRKILQVHATLVGIISQHDTFVFGFLSFKTPIGTRHLKHSTPSCLFNLHGEGVVLDGVYCLLLLFLIGVVKVLIVLVFRE